MLLYFILIPLLVIIVAAAFCIPAMISNSAHLKRREVRTVPICLSKDAFQRRFQARAAQESLIPGEPYYEFTWGTDNRFSIRRRIYYACTSLYRPAAFLTLSGTITPMQCISYRITGFLRPDYPQKREVERMETMLNELCR